MAERPQNRLVDPKVIAFLRENWLRTNPEIVDAHGALLLIDPANDTQFASISRNTACFFDAGDDDNARLADRALALRQEYESRGCSHCFVYLQPTPALLRTMAALQQAGFHRFDIGGFRPRYHTLGRALTTPISTPVIASEYPIRRLDARQEDGDVIERFGAFDGETCIGHAALHVIGDFALLAAAGTDEAYRNRGIQSALIRTRLNRAIERGRTVALCETLSILGSSLNNLKRDGFEILYDKPVFEWRRNAKADTA